LQTDQLVLLLEDGLFQAIGVGLGGGARELAFVDRHCAFQAVAQFLQILGGLGALGLAEKADARHEGIASQAAGESEQLAQGGAVGHGEAARIVDLAGDGHHQALVVAGADDDFIARVKSRAGLALQHGAQVDGDAGDITGAVGIDRHPHQVGFIELGIGGDAAGQQQRLLDGEGGGQGDVAWNPHRAGDAHAQIRGLAGREGGDGELIAGFQDGVARDRRKQVVDDRDRQPSALVDHGRDLAQSTHQRLFGVGVGQQAAGEVDQAADGEAGFEGIEPG